MRIYAQISFCDFFGCSVAQILIKKFEFLLNRMECDEIRKNIALNSDELQDTDKKAYLSYMENRVLEKMNQVVPWGINGETAKWLLMEALEEQETAKSYPVPSVSDVDRILGTFWNMDHLAKSQCEDEVESLKIFDMDGKNIRHFITTPNGIYAKNRIFTDIGADCEVLREVAHETSGKTLPRESMELCEEFIRKKCPTLLNRAMAEKTVTDIVQERQEITYRRFNEEDTVGPERWDWLKDKQDKLGKNEATELLMRTIFHSSSGSEQTPSGTSLAIRPTRNTNFTIPTPTPGSRLRPTRQSGGPDVLETAKMEESSRKRNAASGKTRPAKTLRRGKL